MLIWRKSIAARLEETWLKHLSFLKQTQFAVINLPGEKAARLEVYSNSKKEVNGLIKQFGGEVRKFNARSYLNQKLSLNKPIRIRQKLLIVGSEYEKRRCTTRFPKRKTLLIPAAMAFGTGQHETTASCLRFLSDISAQYKGKEWDLLDLGTGSGILAIAGKALGAHKVDAFDFDPHAVRTAKKNVRSNGITSISIKRLDATHWIPTKTWNVITANLYSEILIQASHAIAAAICKNGKLIFSGIMSEQKEACVNTFEQQGFKINRIHQRGKWVTGLATRIA